MRAGSYSTEEQYVLYAAATSMTLWELLWTWEPWRPTYDLPDMLVNVPRLAAAICELTRLGLIEVFAGPSGDVGESGLVLSCDVAAIVCDANNWWTEDGVPLMIELGITDAAGMVSYPLPDRRPRTSDS